MQFDQELVLAAERAARTSQDPHCQVGCLAILADGTRIEGANQMPDGIDPEPGMLGREEKLYWMEHAEVVALTRAARIGRATQGAVLYVTRFPCAGCARFAKSAGVSLIVSPDPEPDHPRWGSSFRRAASILHKGNVRHVSTGPRRRSPPEGASGCRGTGPVCLGLGFPDGHSSLDRP